MRFPNFLDLNTRKSIHGSEVGVVYVSGVLPRISEIILKPTEWFANL